MTSRSDAQFGMYLTRVFNAMLRHSACEPLTREQSSVLRDLVGALASDKSSKLDCLLGEMVRVEIARLGLTQLIVLKVKTMLSWIYDE